LRMWYRCNYCCNVTGEVTWYKRSGAVHDAYRLFHAWRFAWISDTSKTMNQHSDSRAANMRLLSRSVAFAVALAGAVLPNVSQSQVVPAIRGGGSQMNVY